MATNSAPERSTPCFTIWRRKGFSAPRKNWKRGRFGAFISPPPAGERLCPWPERKCAGYLALSLKMCQGERMERSGRDLSAVAEDDPHTTECIAMGETVTRNVFMRSHLPKPAS